MGHLSLLIALVLLLAGCQQRQEHKQASLPPLIIPPSPQLSEAGYQLILDYEVGGGFPYYDKFLSFPTVPPEQSGVTIGIGVDLGYVSEPVFRQDWNRLNETYQNRLARTVGKTGAAARATLSSVRDILIEWGHAEAVFNEVTIARYYSLTKRTYPELPALHPNAQAALVSLVFNRGGSLIGARRREMAEIADYVPRQDYRAIAAALRRMKKLWPNTPGLQVRREAEARLVEQCL
jgi:hypothetical protein